MATLIYSITGDLTMHGQTKPITFAATLNKTGFDDYDQTHTMGFTGSASSQRGDFGVSTYLPNASDPNGIGNEVTFTIDTEFKRPKSRG